jgi:hypothetical protein
MIARVYNLETYLGVERNVTVLTEVLRRRKL